MNKNVLTYHLDKWHNMLLLELPGQHMVGGGTVLGGKNVYRLVHMGVDNCLW